MAALRRVTSVLHRTLMSPPSLSRIPTGDCFERATSLTMAARTSTAYAESRPPE
ncbi:hypothetical protein [Nocardioides sp. AN3]